MVTGTARRQPDARAGMRPSGRSACAWRCGFVVPSFQRQCGLAACLPSAPARALSREVSGGGRSGQARFSVTNLAARTTPGAQVFLCQHHTPELVWLPGLQRHANTATAIAAVAFATDWVA